MWTEKSYNAIFVWRDRLERERVEKILLEDGLDDVVARLNKTENPRIWYEIVCEAAQSAGHSLVSRLATTELKRIQQRKLIEMQK